MNIDKACDLWMVQQDLTSSFDIAVEKIFDGILPAWELHDIVASVLAAIEMFVGAAMRLEHVISARTNPERRSTGTPRSLLVPCANTLQSKENA